jgi:hypothetical protein
MVSHGVVVPVVKANLPDTSQDSMHLGDYILSAESPIVVVKLPNKMNVKPVAISKLQFSSVITLKPATCGHFKTGHFGWPET